MNGGLAYLAHGGSYILVGVVQDDLQFPDPEFHRRETSLLASRNAQRVDFDYVIQAIETGKIDTSAFHTHSTTLERAVQDLPKWANSRGDVIKAIIRT